MDAPAVEVRSLDELPTAAMFAKLSVEQIGPWIAGSLAAIAGYLARCGTGPAGMPYARYHRIGDSGSFEVEVGFPASAPVAGEGDVQPSSLPAGPAAVIVHLGPYDEMQPTYAALTTWLEEHGSAPAGDPWEVYFSDPAAVPDPARWRTEIVQPFRPA